MAECSSGDSFCSFSLAFGILSIICLLLLVKLIKITEAFLYHSNKHIVILFLAQALCLVMVFQYFISNYSDILYFIKEYLLLFVYCVATYYFIFQAYFLLEQNILLKYLVFSSGLVCLFAFFVILFIFALNIVVGYSGVSCNNYL